MMNARRTGCKRHRQNRYLTPKPTRGCAGVGSGTPGGHETTKLEIRLRSAGDDNSWSTSEYNCLLVNKTSFSSYEGALSKDWLHVRAGTGFAAERDGLTLITGAVLNDHTWFDDARQSTGVLKPEYLAHAPPRRKP